MKNLANQQRCFDVLLPFVGEDQANIFAARPSCRGHIQNDIRKARKSSINKFSKRRKTFLKRAHDLQKDCDVDIFVVVRSKKNNQLWQYSNGYVPPTSETLVSRKRISLQKNF